MRFVSILTASTPLALAAVALPASANDATPGVEVTTSDLDLTQQADQQSLDTRIEGAVRKMCRSGMGGVAAHRIEKRCRTTALANAQVEARVAIAAAKRAKVLRLAANARFNAG